MTECLFHHRQELAYLIPPGGTAIELGVAAGVFSEQLLLTNPEIKLLYSIDRWTDHHGLEEMTQAHDRLEVFGTRSVIIRSTFAKAVFLFDRESSDLIYIDGYAHTGQEGGQTLRDWWPIVKPGGVLSGHDYDLKFSATVDAVNAFVLRHGLDLCCTTDDHYASWWVRKP